MKSRIDGEFDIISTLSTGTHSPFPQVVCVSAFCHASEREVRALTTVLGKGELICPLNAYFVTEI